MKHFIKKDLLLFFRDRKELVIVLTLPILLVVVLNYAFSGFLDNDQEALDLQLGIVKQEDPKTVLKQLEEKLIKEAAMDQKEASQTIKGISQIRPVEHLLKALKSQEMKKWITVHTLQEEEAIKQLKEGDLDGILIIPNSYTVDSLYAILQKTSPKISLKYKIDQETTQNQTLFHLIQGIVGQMNIHSIIQQMPETPQIEVKQPTGGFERIGSGENFTLKQYFTITMGVLFALLLSSTVAVKTGVEIRQQVLNRIILTNRHPLLFLIGKIVSTFSLAWLQMMFVFVISHLLFKVFPDRSITFWLGVIGIVSLFSLAIAGLSALFTTIFTRVTNLDRANSIFTFFIIFFGILGGNFVPIFVLPDWLQPIGEWTPNGLALIMFTEWFKFESISSLYVPSLFLIAFFFLCTAIGVALFPKRGKTS